MIETYIITIDYPSSKAHQQLKGDGQVEMKLCVKKDGQESTTKLAIQSFQKEIATLLRSLCVLTQTLAPLPSKYNYVCKLLLVFNSV